MDTKELINNEINRLVTKKEKEILKLDKIRNDDSPNTFIKRIELEANIKSLTETIFVLHGILAEAKK